MEKIEPKRYIRELPFAIANKLHCSLKEIHDYYINQIKNGEMLTLNDICRRFGMEPFEDGDTVGWIQNQVIAFELEHHNPFYIFTVERDINTFDYKIMFHNTMSLLDITCKPDFFVKHMEPKSSSDCQYCSKEHVTDELNDSIFEGLEFRMFDEYAGTIDIYVENGDSLAMLIMDEAGNTLMKRSTEIKYCPMCGRKLF